MKMGSQNIISVVDYIRTFNPPSNRILDYGLAYLHEKGTLQDLLSNEPYPTISPSLNDSSPSTRRDHLSGKRIPRSVRAIDDLADIGFRFPLRYDSDAAEKLLLLYAMNLFGGHIDLYFLPGFHIRKEHLKNIQKRSGLKFKPFDRDYYTLKKSANPLGRGLYVMGLPKNQRTATATVDFSQIDYCIAHAKELPELSNILINEMLYNRTKIGREETHCKVLRLSGHSIKKSANQFAQRISKLLTTMFDGLEFHFQSKKRTTERSKKEATLWVPHTVLTYEKIRAMMSYNVLYPETIDVLLDR